MAQCTAKSKQSGERCKRPSSPGKTVCYYHGGARGSGRPPKHARYSKNLQNTPRVAELYEYHKTDPKFNETMNEIAYMRALLSNLMEKQSDEEKLADPILMRDIGNVIDIITKGLERRHKMLYGEKVSISVDDWQAFVTRVMSLVKETYGDDDHYTEFCQKVETLYMKSETDDGDSD